jgi:hypothetical protein
MLSEAGCGGADSAGSAREARQDGVLRKEARVGVRVVLDEAAGAEVWVVQDLSDVVDRADSNLGGLEEVDVLLLGSRRDEVADDGVERLDVYETFLVAAKARVVRKLGTRPTCRPSSGRRCAAPCWPADCRRVASACR